MNCTERIYSEDYYDIIVNNQNILDSDFKARNCSQEINKRYTVFYVNGEEVGPYTLNFLQYSTIPDCYTILDQSALEVSGITRVQNLRPLMLNGQGIMIGFIDTGITYENSSFKNSDGTSRIIGIWDQTIDTPRHPLGFQYGTEYTNQEINAALASPDPKEIVPSTDEIGHGTYMASIAAGSEDIPQNFIGAAPFADIAMVKLKPAKKNLRDFYFIRDGAIAYQENDILAGIDYLQQLASMRQQPLVLCFGLGTNQGDHAGSSRMEAYLDYLSTVFINAVCVAVGNEANARHHFYGTITRGGESERVEVNVTEDMKGFPMELWARAPDKYSISITSPTGEVLPRIPVQAGRHQEYQFLLERTKIMIDYVTAGQRSKGLLIYIEFQAPIAGIWTMEVYGSQISVGNYNIWLPMSTFLEKEVYFLRSNPDTTLTVPSSTELAMSVGGYDAVSGGIYLESGRGYSANGYINPDYSAPAVSVYGQNNRGDYGTLTGTSAAAAISAGASALLMEWNIKYQEDLTVNSLEIRNQIIAGADKREDFLYPNREEGDYVNIVPS